MEQRLGLSRLVRIVEIMLLHVERQVVWSGATIQPVFCRANNSILDSGAESTAAEAATAVTKSPANSRFFVVNFILFFKLALV
jgi:hypothetical protein